VPHSRGYEAYKDEYIGRVLRDDRLLSLFKGGKRLPGGYGFGLDERCVEYPWLLAHIGAAPERVLDAGSALNHLLLLRNATLVHKKLHILTLAPEHYAFWQLGISYLYEDLRRLPMHDSLYDSVVCISTLEHVGLDSSFYTHREEHQESQPCSFVQAIKEMLRVLKPGGRLFLTVPYGRYKNIGVMQVFDDRLLQDAIDAFGPSTVSKRYYLYTGNGWQTARAEECAEAVYVEAYFDYFKMPPEERPVSIPREPDNAAAARAVVCVLLTRPEQAGG
jgi:SAM-dependent methyltransferase